MKKEAEKCYVQGENAAGGDICDVKQQLSNASVMCARCVAPGAQTADMYNASFKKQCYKISRIICRKIPLKRSDDHAKEVGQTTIGKRFPLGQQDLQQLSSPILPPPVEVLAIEWVCRALVVAV